MKNFNVSVLRGRNRCLLATVINVKGQISGGIKGFSCLIKKSIMDKILLKFHLLSTLIVFQKVVYLIGHNLDNQSPL